MLQAASKTYEFDKEASIATEAAVLFELKNLLVGDGATTFTTPWTTIASSDGVTADATDRWLDSGDIVFENPGVAHSWWRGRQTGVDAGFEIIIEADKNPAGGSDAWHMVISETGFSGGSITARPTAADEVEPVEGGEDMLIVNSHNLAVDAANLYLQMSGDGSVTRWMIFVDGILLHFVDIQVPIISATNWTIPWTAIVAVQYHASGADAPQCTFAQLAAEDPPTRVYSRAGGIESPLFLTGEAAGTDAGGEQLLGIAQTFTNALEPEGAWPTFPIGLYSETFESQGRIGQLTDLWWGSATLATGNHYPGDTTKTFVHLDDLVSPWDGTTIVIT